MKIGTSARTALPITAAITLASASFSGRASAAAASFLTEPLKSEQTTSSRAYPPSILSGLLTLVETLQKHQDFMPPSPGSLTAFNELQRDGTLAAVPLSPLEQRALLLSVEYGTAQVIRGLIRAHGDVRNGSIEESAILGRVTSAPQPPRQAATSHAFDDYDKALRLLYLLAGISELEKDPSVNKQALLYLAKAPPDRATLLITLLGASQMQPRLSSDAPSALITSHFIQTMRRRISADDCHSIKQLESLSLGRDNKAALVGLVTSLTGVIALLYRRGRAQTELAEASDAPPVVTKDELRSNVNE